MERGNLPWVGAESAGVVSFAAFGPVPPMWRGQHCSKHCLWSFQLLGLSHTGDPQVRCPRLLSFGEPEYVGVMSPLGGWNGAVQPRELALFLAGSEVSPGATTCATHTRQL